MGVNSVTAKKLDIIAYWHLRKVKIKQNLMTTTLTTEQNSNTEHMFSCHHPVNVPQSLLEETVFNGSFKHHSYTTFTAPILPVHGLSAS